MWGHAQKKKGMRGRGGSLCVVVGTLSSKAGTEKAEGSRENNCMAFMFHLGFLELCRIREKEKQNVTIEPGRACHERSKE